MGFLTTLINSTLGLFGSAASALLLLLPDSPFQWNLSGTSEALKWIFWLFPIPGMVTTLTAYVAAVSLYYVIRTALRWMKVVGS